ncbi:MAG TPA: hypothetical protein VHI13_12645, partial [Candidatus Kapabacteria bacterium]|nr:hypothetical protein [Candidatus Kapabacteria bacterium]
MTAEDIRNISHGVSGVRIYFDWDADEDAGTFQAPAYDGAGDTAQYAIADVDGNFSFTRQVTAENDSWVWNVHRIRLYATAWNDAAYFKEWGKDAVFSSGEPVIVPVSITPAASDISGSIMNWNVARDQGTALRLLWRARQFAIEDFWLTPPQIRFDLDYSDGQSSFTSGLPAFYSPTITFTGFPNSETAYHEYGHYAHFLWAGAGRFPATGNCGAHDYPLVTNDACAMVEGWAEFFCAAAHTFWYERERPAVREVDAHHEPYVQFLDRLYGEVPANNGDCEGGVARFLFNLWDGIALRSPGTPNFTGDNEDLYHANYGDRNGGHPHPWLLYTLKDIFRYKQVVTIPNGVRQVRESPFIDVYRRRYLEWVDGWFPFTSFYHHQSIDASYNRMTTLADELRAATPTVLGVSGDEFQRTLTWNDNTEPQSIVYPPEGVSSSDPIDLANNNEGGFAVWRRTLTFIPRPLFAPNDPAIFDGRLDATCQLIGLVPPDVHMFVDHQYLGSGDHEYVVVAYRRLNNTVPELLSIPLAQGSIRLRGVDIR